MVSKVSFLASAVNAAWKNVKINAVSFIFNQKWKGGKTRKFKINKEITFLSI